MSMKKGLTMNRVIIIGGGASGLAAAIAAAKEGACAVIAERNERVGKKILSTGNGRCNFTNINASAADYNSDFAESVMKKYPPKKIIGFFKDMGMMSREEAEGRVYPASGQASAVLDILRMTAERLGVEVYTGFSAKKINKKNGGFEVVSADGHVLFGDKVIIAAGGCAAPKSGSDGAGYTLLKQLGHSITPLVPSLVQIKTDKGIKGVRAFGKVTLENGRSETGEIQFNDYGISGIPVFCLSRYVKKGMKISVDLVCGEEFSDLAEYLKNRRPQPLETFLVGIVNKALGQMLLKDLGFAPLSKNSADLTQNEIKRIAYGLKNWEFTVTGTMPWDNAQVTAGGAELAEFDPETLESKLVQGVYAAGEVLDIDAPCGGYNLQWAWASGLCAGSEAANV